MDTVKAIIDKLGGVNGASEKTGFPQQTVSSWVCRKPPDIPPWRRPAIAACAEQAIEPLTRAEMAYLESTKRTPKVKGASC